MSQRFDKHVGLRIVENAGGTSLLTLPIEAPHFNFQGVVHGGALFTLADTGMGAALYPTLAPGEGCATIEIKINYFRAVRGGEVVCRSQVVHRGRTTAAIESTLSVGDTVVGKATGTFAITQARAASPRVPDPAAGEWAG